VPWDSLQNEERGLADFCEGEDNNAEKKRDANKGGGENKGSVKKALRMRIRGTLRKEEEPTEKKGREKK